MLDSTVADNWLSIPVSYELPCSIGEGTTREISSKCMAFDKEENGLESSLSKTCGH